MTEPTKAEDFSFAMGWNDDDDAGFVVICPTEFWNEHGHLSDASEFEALFEDGHGNSEGPAEGLFSLDEGTWEWDPEFDTAMLVRDRLLEHGLTEMTEMLDIEDREA